MAEFNIANDERSTIVDLDDGDLCVGYNTWQTAESQEEVESAARGEYGVAVTFKRFLPVVDTCQLIARGTSAGIRAAIRELQDALEGARQYRIDPVSRIPWWLEASTEDEPARRSLIYRGTIKPLGTMGLDPFLTRDAMRYELGIEHHPFYEPLTGTTLGPMADVSICGGTYFYTDVEGVVPARISEMVVAQTNALEDDVVTTLWAGFRPEYEGCADFNPVWPLAEGTEGTDAVEAVDATAYSGERVTVSFATTAAWAQRSMIHVLEVALYNSHANYHHFRGRYLVLGRVKLSAASTTVGLRIKATGQAAAGDVFVTNTVWRLVPLGYVQIPAWGGIDIGMSWGHYSSWNIRVYAKRIEGAGSLYLDCLILVPQPYALTVAGTSMGGATNYDTHVVTLPDDRRTAFGYFEFAEAAGDTLPLAASSFYLPVGNGVMVLAGDCALGHVLDATLDVEATYYPRWKSYREDELGS